MSKKKKQPVSKKKIVRPSKSKGQKKPIKRWLIMALVTIVALELISPLFYRIVQKKSFSRSAIKGQIEKIANASVLEGVNANSYAGIHVLHPYLGYVKNKETRKFANDFGMINESPIVKRDENTVNIAVTGGSVALAFFNTKTKFLEELQKYEAFAGKKVNVVSLALEGYKQPQQLIALNYFTFLGGEYDILLNIDGFNDLVLAYDENLRTRVYPFFPRSWNSYATKAINPKQSIQFGEMNRLKNLQVERANTFNKFPLNFSNFLLTTWSVLNNKYERTISNLYRSYNESAKSGGMALDFQSSGPMVSYASDQDALEDIIQKWSNASIQMDILCKGLGIQYYHFLQPSQYLPNTKTFSPEENKTAYINAVVGSKSNNLDYLKGQTVKKVYKNMIEEGLALKNKKDIKFVDLTNIFKEVPETVYADFCCHLNDRGNQIMATYIAQAIKDYHKK